MTTVVNAEYGAGTFASPSVHTLGFTPSAGNTLIVVGFAETAVTIDSLTDDDTNSYTEDANGDSNRWSVQRLSNIPAGIASLSWSYTGSTSNVNTYVIEVSGLDNISPLQDTSAYASDGDGFVDAHGVEYTTIGANELVVCTVRPNANRTVTGTGGATAINTGSDNNNVVYEVVASAETADITFNFGGSAANNSSLLVSYSEAAGGGGSILPLLNAYYS